MTEQLNKGVENAENLRKQRDLELTSPKKAGLSFLSAFSFLKPKKQTKS